MAKRALFEDRLAHDFALLRRQGHRLAVLFVDLDEFKPINDSLGHEVGDQLLVEVSRRMEAVMRAGDTLALLGGDEFVVLLPDLRHEEQAIQMARRLLPLIARPHAVRSPGSLSPGAPACMKAAWDPASVFTGTKPKGKCAILPVQGIHTAW